MIPLLLLGSLALLILSLPIPAYQTFMTELFGEGWNHIFLFVRDGTFNILSLLMVICISYAYINELGYDYKINPIIASSVALASYIAASGIHTQGFSLSHFSATGIFMAIMVSSASSYLYVKLSSFRFLKLRAYTSGADAVFQHALASIFPAGITVLVFAGLNSMMTEYLQISNIQSFIQNSFSNIFIKIDSPFISGLFFIFLVHVFWFFGIHGSNVLEPAVQTIFAPGTEINQQLLLSGKLPEVVFTKTFFDSFVLIGGCGTAFCLVLALLIVGKSRNLKGLARLSFLPLLFNINELLIFGIPIVLNPIFLIPFIGVPIILTILSFLAIHLGLVPYTVHTVEWTTPILLSGYAATQSIKGSLLQLFNLLLGTAIYIPFVKLSESASSKLLHTNIQKVYSVYKQNEERGYPPALLSRHDEIGNISRFLAADLSEDIKNRNIKLYYQPQTDFDGHIFGIEALLRWEHQTYGSIYPPLTIALSEEANLINSLGRWIFSQSCSDLRKLHNAGFNKISLSVNVSAVQLEDEEFISGIKEIMEQNNLPYHSLKIEITEQIALTGSKKILSQINSIRELGIKLAMDDFGMGHSSIKYLKEYEFDTIKLDGCLVREVLSNANCRNIISSLVYLGKSLNCSIIAEYVEEAEQRSALYQLGCDKYQGYLCSKPLPFEDLILFLNSQQ